jgi:hypothetical protein
MKIDKMLILNEINQEIYGGCDITFLCYINQHLISTTTSKPKKSLEMKISSRWKFE